MQSHSVCYHKPNDCRILFGIPTSRQQFENARRRGRSELAGLYPWPQYEHDVIGPCTRILPRLRARGVHVVVDVTLECLGETLARVSTQDIVILFTHWTAEQEIELAGQAVSIHDTVAAVPGHWDGILDLCICHPTGLAESLAELKPRCLVRSGTRKAVPAFWLIFYDLLTYILRAHELTYPTALEMAIRTLGGIHDESVPSDRRDR